MESKKNCTDEPYLQGQEWRHRGRLRTQQGKGWGKLKSSADIFTFLSVTQMASGKRLQSPGSSAWLCDGLARWDRKREVQQGGDTCKHIADSRFAHKA